MVNHIGFNFLQVYGLHVFMIPLHFFRLRLEDTVLQTDLAYRQVRHEHVFTFGECLA